ncbi:DUF4124 domain-containing protein [Oxalobacteraceae bacterium A2-2]
MTTRTRFCFSAVLLVAGAAQAQGQIFLCVDAQGRKELTDTARPAAQCRVLDVPGAQIPAPPRRVAPARSGAAASGAAAATPGVATPGSFPRVDSAEQRARDADRRAILDEELRSELQKLAALRLEYNNGQPERRGDEHNYAKYQERTAALRDNISRSEKNVDALKREIANIK